MAKYTIRLNYNATYTTTVEGEFRNEGDALDAAREQAERALRYFFILHFLSMKKNLDFVSFQFNGLNSYLCPLYY